MQANLKFARPLAVALGLFALSGTAYAADVVQEEPPAPAPVAELPVASWAGPYAGINLGYGFSGRTKERDFGVETDTKGFVGSAFGGYQWQQENFVYGAEAELGYKRASVDEANVNQGLTAPAVGGFRDAEGRTSVLSAMVNVLLDFGDDDGWSGYVGGGAGLARVKYNVDVNGLTPALGFSDSANFRHAFHKWVSQSPSEFRRRANRAGG